MLAIELLSEIIPAVKPNDKASEVLNWMEVFRVSHLPVVENSVYTGLISDTEIFDHNNIELTISEHNLVMMRPFAFSHQHIYEIVSLLSEYRLTVLPVLDEKEKYLGVISAVDLAMHFSHLMAADNPGGIIVLELGVNDYSLSEISQIVESNDNKILSLYIRTIEKHQLIEVTIKLNRTDVSAVLQTFNRYNYKIKAVYGKSAEVDTLMQERIDSLLNFLNI